MSGKAYGETVLQLGGANQLGGDLNFAKIELRTSGKAADVVSTAGIAGLWQ